MGEQSKIEWTDDTHNFWQGCTKISPGCANCYAEARDRRFYDKAGITHWGNGAPRVRSKDFNAPLRWNNFPWVCDCKVQAGTTKGKRYFSKDIAMTAQEIRLGTFDCCECGRPVHRRRVFSLSLGDWLDDEVPIAWLADMLDVIRRCPNLDFLLLTKRPENFFGREAREYKPSRLGLAQEYALANSRHELFGWLCEWGNGKPPHNIRIGTSVENQHEADKRIPEVLKIPAKTHFISMEPLLSAVDLPASGDGHFDDVPIIDGINWVIVGGESGLNARPCNVGWIRDIVQQCKASRVPCFVKQLGGRPLLKPCRQHHFDWRYKTTNENRPDDKLFAEDGDMWRVLLNDKKGGVMSEWPEDLRVRQFPEVAR